MRLGRAVLRQQPACSGLAVASAQLVVYFRIVRNCTRQVFFDRAARIRKCIGCCTHRCDNLIGGYTQAVVRVEGYSQPADVHVRWIAKRHRNNVWIVPVRPGYDRQYERKVLHIPRHWPILRQRIDRAEAMWHNMPSARHSPRVRFYSRNAAVVSRAAHAAARVTADVERRPPQHTIAPAPPLLPPGARLKSNGLFVRP